MASVFKTDRTKKKWCVKWKTSEGKYKGVVTPYTNKRDALRYALEQEKKALVERLMIVEETTYNETAGWKFDDLANWWIENHLPRLQGQDAIILKMRKHLLGNPTLNACRVSELTSQHIERVLMTKDGVIAPATVNQIRATISSIFGRAYKAGLVDTNPVHRVEKRKIIKKTYMWITAEDTESFLSAIEDDNWRMIIAIAIFSGMRKGELFALRMSDVDLSASVIHIRRSWKRDTTKSGKHRMLPISRRLKPWIEQAVARASTLSSDTLFVDDKGKPFGSNSRPQDMINDALKKAGIKKERPLNFHSLRHSFASQLLNAGANIYAVQKLLGHSTIIMTTQTYGHLMDDTLAEAINML